MTIDPTFLSWMPLLMVATGMLLLLPTALLTAHRMPATVTIGAMLLGGLFVQLMNDAPIVPTQLASFLLAACLIAAPLLERARTPGLLIAGLLGAAVMLYGIPQWLIPSLPGISATQLLLVQLIVAVTIGMGGGLGAELHPLRRDAKGRMVWHDAAQAPMLLGWMALILAIVFIVGTAALTRSHAITMVTAGLVALLHGYHRAGADGLQKAGEALTAGLLIGLLVATNPWQAMLIGLLAGYVVVRSEAIAHSMQIDDPHHLLGALLIPSMLGLLMQGIGDMAVMADAVKWLGAALLFGIIVALLLWPATKLLLGIALPTRLMRQGPANA